MDIVETARLYAQKAYGAMTDTWWKLGVMLLAVFLLGLYLGANS